MKFYIDINKSTSNWTYHLRLRTYPDQPIGQEVTRFNPYTCMQNPGVMERIVSVLNKDLEKKS